MNRIITALYLLAICSSALADQASFSDRIETAMESEIRNEADTERDRNRKPVETLAFFGIDDGMRVLELFPGRGWYTKLLAPALRENGEFMAAAAAVFHGVRRRWLSRSFRDDSLPGCVQMISQQAKQLRTGVAQ